MRLTGCVGKSGNNMVKALLAMVVAAALATAGCGGQPAAPAGKEAALKEVRVGMVPLPHYAHMWVAKKKGYIDEELNKAGYRLNWQPFGLGPMVSEAFAAGRLDMGVMGDFPALIGRSAGTDYRIAGIASTAPRALALVTAKGSAIAGVAELRGKKVATTKGAYGQKLLTMLLERNGLTMADIIFVHMTMDDLGTALLRGDVAAGVMWDPLLTRLEEAGEIRVIADGQGVYEAYAVLMVGGRLADEHPAAVDAVLRAFRRGSQELRQNPDACLTLLMEDMRIPRPQLAGIVAKFAYDDTITARFVSDLKDTEAFMRRNDLLKGPVDVEAFVWRK